MNKKRMYLILIIIASAILAGLIIWAVYISIKPAQGTKPDKDRPGTTTQAAEATEDGTSQTEGTTGEETTAPEDTTGTTEEETTTGEETTAPTETKEPGKQEGGNQDPDNEDPGEDEKNEEDSGDSGDSGTVTPPPTPTEPTLPDVYPYTVTYKEYLDMTEDAQIAFYKEFKNHDEFKKWRTAAKKEYDENKVEIEIGEDGVIDLDKITGKN